ncbi:prepilin peptidase [Nocardioides sp. BGMRC 2183]|nr:prepilin peptidase [Nocardioides sp. BGMRC 2183]
MGGSEWHLVAAVLGAVVGVVSGLAVPALVRALPEPAPDPDEDPDDFPEKVPYVELAGRRGLATGCAVAGAVAGGALGAMLGLGLALAWLLVLLLPGLALAVVDYVTWFLPSRIIWPTAALVVTLQTVAAVAWSDWRVLGLAGLGFVAVGGYYGLLWLVSPRLMAFGDVRLGALLGLALGPFGLPTLLLSVLAAAVVGALALVPLRRAGNTIRRHVPFGPFLLVGAVVAVVAGQVLAEL